MPISRLKITSKGQVTLNKDVLNHFGLRPGDSLVLEYGDAEGGLLRPAPKNGIERLFGSLTPPTGTKLTLDDIADVIEKGWAGEP